METRAELLKKLELIEKSEKEKEAVKRQESNYKAFTNRINDWVIGKAHAEHTIKDNGWHHPKGYQIGGFISVSGNCGHTYYPTCNLTSASNTYFHNVWTDRQRKSFEDKLNKLAEKEIVKIMKSLRCVVELMGLQSNDYFLTRSNEYPKDKISQMEKDIQKEQFKILDKYKKSEFKKLDGLFHGNAILEDYYKYKGWKK
jgi:hypothetical protein